MTEEQRTERDAMSVMDVDQLQPQETLEPTDVDDVLDEGYSPPEREPAHLRNAPTPADEARGQTLDSRLAEEEPEPDPYAEAATDESVDGSADPRAGRLVAPDEGTGTDTEKDEVAQSVGVDGAGASAEEAAIHLVDDEADPRPLE